MKGAVGLKAAMGLKAAVGFAEPLVWLALRTAEAPRAKAAAGGGGSGSAVTCWRRVASKLCSSTEAAALDVCGAQSSSR